MKLRRSFWQALTGVVLGLGLAVGAVTYAVQQRGTALREAEREVQGLSSTLADWIEDGFRTVDQIQLGVLDWINAEGIDTEEGFTGQLGTERAHQALRARVGALPRLRRLLLADPDGHVILSSRIWPSVPVFGIGDDLVAALRQQFGRSAYLSQARPAQLDGEWIVRLGRRVEAADGRLLGLAVAQIDLAYFQQMFARLNLGSGRAVYLLRSDGTLLAGEPYHVEQIGRPNEIGATFRQLPNADRGVSVLGQGEDGVAQVFGVRAVPGYPAYVVASRKVEDVLGPWRRKTLQLGLATVVFEALIAGTLLIASRLDRRHSARAEIERRLALVIERERAAKAVAELDIALRTIFGSCTAAFTQVDMTTGLYKRVSRGFCQIVGRSEEEIVCRLGPRDLLHPDDHHVIALAWRGATGQSGNWDGEVRYMRKDGGIAWARISTGPAATDADGMPVSCVAVIQDVTGSRQAAERLRASEAMLRLSLQIGHIGAFIRDLRTGGIVCGPETRSLHGFPPGDAPISAHTWLALVVPEDRERVLAEVADAMAARLPENLVRYRFRHPDGSIRHIEARTRYEYDPEGRPLMAMGALIDVTAGREAEARIAHLAHHDALTGLPNRVLFHQRLEEALARASRGEGFAVFCLDLDRFKEVNDTLGHPAGDALLREVADRLRAETREVDTLARLGGDEFAIIQSSVDQPQDASILARRIVEVLGAPFTIDGQDVSIGTSIGIAVAPRDGLDADGLLKEADMALYSAKADGRGRWRFFEPEMDARMQMRRALDLDLRRAIAEDEFALHYQPIVAVTTRRVTGLEGLIRWHHPEQGLVPPDRFISLAEEMRLIVPIGEWALARACQDAAAWPTKSRVAVNLSPAQFSSSRLVESVNTALRRSGLAPERLELEITESVMLHDTESTLATLHRLRGLGVRIALDDFGTGFSSLSYLQRFPFDKVKIDRCFIRNLGRSRQSDAIIRAVTGLCEMLGMTTTAEGVETEEQMQKLLLEGCQEAQGYLFSKPRPVGEIQELLGGEWQTVQADEPAALDAA